MSSILLVTRNLPPLVGGMERLNWHMANELARHAEVRIVGPAGSAALAPPGIAVREAPLRPLWKFLLRARALARHEARAWRPDVVLAGSGLTAPIARGAARLCGARTVVYVHGLDVAVRNAVYRALWLPAIRRADRIIANSHATAAFCRSIGVDAQRIGIVHPGVDLPADVDSRGASSLAVIESDPDRHSGAGSLGRNAESVSTALRRRYRLGDGPILLSVGRLSARKGLREFVAQALPRIVAVQPTATLVVVGDAPSQALHAEAQTPASILAAAKSARVCDVIRFLGKVPDDQLVDLYGVADVHVFPVREVPGDPEGFGMVAIEAAAHGLPTVAFATGGVVDAVAQGRSGRLVPPGDYAAFADAVLATLAERGAQAGSCVEFARAFAWSEFGARLIAELGLA